uniref:Ovule protein n=1 Tax=Ascaris lumbricoides TaxID=6252 RepID=A0A0M3I6K4_ASCLU
MSEQSRVLYSKQHRRFPLVKRGTKKDIQNREITSRSMQFKFTTTMDAEICVMKKEGKQRRHKRL